MSASGVLWSITATGLAAAALASPSELVLDRLPGFELTDGPAVDLSYADFAAYEPDSVAHLEPDSDEATGMLAAIEVWTGTSSEGRIVVELVRAIDDESATTFVDQAAANAIAIGLAATDPPFGGAWSYSGPFDDSWTDVVSWNQGPYAVTMTHVSLVETDRSAIDTAAVRQAEIILEVTGAEVSDDAAVANDAPPPPTEAPEPTEAPITDDDDGGGLPGGIVVGVAVALLAVAAIGLLVARRRRPDPSAAVGS
jgi:hypothetical protein